MTSDGISSVGQHIELEINIYLQRFPPQQRHIRSMSFKLRLFVADGGNK
jgi:hypothetical protein